MSINFQADLNPAQFAAVNQVDGPVLVIAGAGSGKTRTIVYRLAHLIRQGVPQESVLLLTFTRKASREMVRRAGLLLGHDLHGANGSTFHSFAFAALRKYAHHLGFAQGLSVMDQADAEGLAGQAKDDLKLGKGDRSFPKKATVLGLISKSRNKELPLERLLEKEAFHLLGHASDILAIEGEYSRLKARHGLADYDDLLFLLERLLTEQPEVRDFYRRRFSHLMVDEYQDTNLVQARLVKLLAGEGGNVMAVGDDAQSIYAFRGANVVNILSFPQDFPGAAIIRLEQNYRSCQPILDLTNHILDQAAHKFEKRLFSERTDGPKPRLIRVMSDQSQAKRAAALIIELARTRTLDEIAVLFRAGYQSFSLEVELNRQSVPFRKWGGIKFYEAAHIKDVLAYLRVVANPQDLVSWQRVLDQIRGLGPKTGRKIVDAVLAGDEASLNKSWKKFPELAELFGLLTRLRSERPAPAEALRDVLAHYDPVFKERYADDYPLREAGLEELSRLAAGYSDMGAFLADVTLESPDTEEEGGQAVTLSTVHSAKGLEWSAVLIIDLAEERFPSKRSTLNPDDLEEERRLLYVACTRAKDVLALFTPTTVYNRYAHCFESVGPSPFVLELPRDCYEEWAESYGGVVEPVGQRRSGPDTATNACRPAFPGHRTPLADPTAQAEPGPERSTSAVPPGQLGACRHKIFGQGKVVAHIPPDKYKVNFPGFGLKVILADYLEMLPTGGKT